MYPTGGAPGYTPAAGFAAGAPLYASTGAAYAAGGGAAGYAAPGYPAAPAPAAPPYASAPAAAAPAYAALAAAAAAPPAVAEPPPLGLLLPGRPVRTDFVPVGPTRFVLEVPGPGTLPEVGFFLLPGATLPAGTGLAVYWALPPYEDWAILGTVLGTAPSGIWRTGWPSTPEVAAAPAVRIGVSAESEDAIRNLEGGKATAEWDRLGFAQLVAQDLFTFLGSHAQVLPQIGERLVVPPGALDTWLKRVQARFARDPNFLFKRDA